MQPGVSLKANRAAPVPLTCNRHLGRKRTWSVACGRRNRHALGRGNTGIRGRLSGHTSQSPWHIDRREYIKTERGRRQKQCKHIPVVHLRAVVILTAKKLGQLTKVISLPALRPLTLFVPPLDAQFKILIGQFAR